MPGVPVGETLPLVGRAGRGPAASAADKASSQASSADAEHAPPTQPSPTRGEGLRRLALKPNAIPRARALRRAITPSERALWRGLRESLPGLHWRKQVPFGPYTADFCSHAIKLIIEVDGGQHGEPGAQAHDQARTRFLAHEGYRVLRFWNNDVLGNTEGVLLAIADTLPLVGRAGRGPAASAAEGTPPSEPYSSSPPCSSSIVTATSAFAERRTVSPSTAATRPPGMKW